MDLPQCIVTGMSDRWVEEPRHWPREDRVTKHSSPEWGPYFEDSLPFPAGTMDGRTATLYISRARMAEILGAPGSPFANVSREDYDAMREKLLFAERENIRLGIENGELREQLAEAKAKGSSATTDQVADAVLAKLTDAGLRVAAKPGPKPKAAA